MQDPKKKGEKELHVLKELLFNIFIKWRILQH